MRRLIVTADDFGASPAVNAAVARAHGDGLLTAASLMVTGDAAADAVARARDMPDLGVGLHLVLVEGKPALPVAEIPDLVRPDGRFREDMVRASFVIALRASVRAQLAREITAQFAAFAATGLPLDHVNAHKHFHLHPTIAGLILEIGPRFGMRAARAPVEPAAVLAKVEPTRTALSGRVAGVWARRVARRFRKAGVAAPDQVFGLAWSGAFDAARLRALLPLLPDGLTELYFHPATEDRWPGSAYGYAYRAELAALTDDLARAAVRREGITLGSFADFTPEALAA